MPHKHNPVGCVLALSAAGRVPPLVSAFLSSMVQEHERAAGGWQAEWSIIYSVIGATGLAVSAMAEVAEGLTVDAARMRANMDATRGAVFAERAMLVLAEKVGRDAARKLVEEAVRLSREKGRKLSATLGAMRDLPPGAAALLADLENPEQYLGVADELRKRLLASAKENHLDKE